MKVFNAQYEKEKNARRLSKEEWSYIFELTNTVYPFLVKRLNLFESTYGEENVQFEHFVLNYPPRIILFAYFSGRNKDKMIEEFGVVMGEYCTKFNFTDQCSNGNVPYGWDVRKNYVLKKDVEKEMEIRESYSR